MARKSAASELKAARSRDASSSTPTDPANNKRKIDWATIDEDGDFDGFTVKSVTFRTPKKSSKESHKRQKTGTPASEGSENYLDAPRDAEVTQENPYAETELSAVHCKIEPAAEWESMQRYRRFTINKEEFEAGQVLFIKKAEEDHDTANSIPQWFAKVLEVRAGDASHVYLRVYWAYRPEDLPGGRQPYHGESELIVSNHMDIIEALTVESTANLIYWEDDPEKSEWPAKEQLFWRQSLDINQPRGKQLTKLKTYCVDKAPCNPDEPLVNCPSCKEWLHAHCLEEEAVKDAHKKYKIPLPKQPKGKARAKATETGNEAAITPLFTAKFSPIDESGKSKLTVTDKREGQDNRQWDVDVNCLICKKTIEKATDTNNDARERPTSTAPSPPKADAAEEAGITVAHQATSTSTAPITQSHQKMVVRKSWANTSKVRSPATTSQAVEPELADGEVSDSPSA
ncbi:Nn.00g058610.m01.CDS01 [Neocucurbitaria sp. VM-36]